MANKISICMIVGNVSEYITRCLESFKPVMDELCVVRAIGAAKPDNTMDLVRELAARHGIPLHEGEYFNKPEHADWPHVDNFAAARQMSFDLATSDYCIWCDSDDVLKMGAEYIREHADKGEYHCYMFPYEIFGSGISLPRERMVRKTECRWIHPVHECLEFFNPPAKALQDDMVVITHLPKPDREGSHPRNRRILMSIPDEEMNTGLLFHLVEELIVARDVEEAVKFAGRLLARPDLGRPEKMELFINLSSVSTDPVQVEGFLIQAYAADPRRREALARLCHHMLNYDHPDFALAFARQMLSIPVPPPEVRPWNHNHGVYGWLGEELYAESLRMAGFGEEADRISMAEMQRNGGPVISLIHATRGRPKQAATARKAWLELAAHPERIEHIFVVDDDDETRNKLRRFRHMEIPAGGGCVAAWNSGVCLSSSQVLVQMSDDWLPPQKWDELILERIGDVLRPVVLSVNDGSRTDKLICMAICTRNYMRLDCFMFHPFFKSMYSDNWFTHCAYERGAVIEARDLVFTHKHPCFGLAETDATYDAQNSPERYDEGKKIFDYLLTGRDWSSIPGFFDYFQLYRIVADLIKDGDTIAEVGVWLGRSLTFMAQTLRAQKKRVNILAVDTFQGEVGIPEHQTVVTAHGGSIRGAFEENIKRCGISDMVEIIQGDSAASAGAIPDGSLAFVFIDAAHDYESVRKDLEAWWPKVKPGGTMAGHDAGWHEVARAVKEKFSDVVIQTEIWVKHKDEITNP